MRDKTASGWSTILAAVGFALYWPTLRQFELGSLLGRYADPARANRFALIAVLVCLVCLCMVAMVGRRRIEPLFNRPSSASLALGSMGALGSLALWGAPACGVLAGPVFGLGALGCAVGYLALTLAWASALLTFDGGRVLGVVAFGYALGSYAPLLDIAGTPWTLLFTLTAPLGSTLAWWLLGFRAREHRDTDYSLGSLGSLPVLLLGMVVLFLLVGRIAVGSLVAVDSRIELPVRVVDTAVACLFAAALLVFARLTGPGGWRTTFKAAWVLLALVVIAGLLLMLAGVTPYPATAQGLVAAGFNCFELFLWALLMHVARDRGLSVTLVFCCVFSLCKVVPLFCGKLLAPWVARFVGEPGGALMTLLLVGLVFLLVAATSVFLAFGGRIWGHGEGAKGDARSATTSTGKSTAPVSEERVRLYGLTPREVEVVGCVLKGFSYQKTAEVLGVSVSTVQSHVKNLYRKLGVHTRDELVDWARE